MTATEFPSPHTFFWSGAIIYAAAFCFALLLIAKARRYSRVLLLAILGLGFIFQSIGLIQRGIATGSFPLGNAFEVFQFLAWSAILIYMAIGPVFRMSLMGFFTAGMATVMSFLSLCIQGMDSGRNPDAFGGELIVEIHAGLAIFSYAVFLVLAVTSMMYLLQLFSLKKKTSKGLFPMLPSIVQLDAMSERLLLFGLVVLTAALWLGAGNWLFHLGKVLMSKLIITALVWVFYTAILVFKKWGKLLPHQFAWACVILFLFALFSLWPVEKSRPEIDSPSDEITLRTLTQPADTLETETVSINCNPVQLIFSRTSSLIPKISVK